MKVYHTPIQTKKAGKKVIAACEFKPENWNRKPIGYEQAGSNEAQAIEKAKNFLSTKGRDELVEVESFAEDKPVAVQSL